MQPKSNNLFHFTKSLEFLKGILEKGFLPRFSLEDASYLAVDYVAFPMTCFCDIPLSRISEHTLFYGAYGLGMTKEWGLKNGLIPLIYTPPTGPIVDLSNFLFDHVEGESTNQGNLNKQFFSIIPYIKPIKGTMVVAGEIVEKEFYQESEWRFVPEHGEILGKKNFDERKDAENKKMEDKALQFLPSDVRYIFVKTDAEIPATYDFLQKTLGHFPLTEIKILTSRIISLETLAKDM